MFSFFTAEKTKKQNKTKQNKKKKRKEKPHYIACACFRTHDDIQYFPEFEVWVNCKMSSNKT